MNKKFIFTSVILAIPVMLMYQNCGKTNSVAMQDMSGTFKKSSLSSEQLPPNNTVNVDQPGAPAAPVDSNLGPGGEEHHECSLSEAISDCSKKESNNSSGHYSNDSVSDLNGKNVLSKEDFGGNDHIKSIDHSFGNLVLCGITVDELSDSGGKVIMIDSIVKHISRFKGKVQVAGPEPTTKVTRAAK